MLARDHCFTARRKQCLCIGAASLHVQNAYVQLTIIMWSVPYLSVNSPYLVLVHFWSGGWVCRGYTLSQEFITVYVM